MLDALPVLPPLHAARPRLLMPAYSVRWCRDSDDVHVNNSIAALAAPYLKSLFSTDHIAARAFLRIRCAARATVFGRTRRRYAGEANSRSDH